MPVSSQVRLLEFIEKKQLIDELEQFLAEKPVEVNRFAKIEALLGTTNPGKKEYGKFVPAILSSEKKPMLVRDILAVYKAKASEDGIVGAESVTENLLKAYLNSNQGKALGITKVKDMDNTYQYKKPITA